MSDKLEKKVDDLEREDSVLQLSRDLLSGLRKDVSKGFTSVKKNVSEGFTSAREYVSEKTTSLKDVDKRFGKIWSRIDAYWERPGTGFATKLEYKTIWEDGKEEEVTIESFSDEARLEITIKREGGTSFYKLQSIHDKKGRIERYDLRTEYLSKNQKDDYSETLKSLSPKEAMKALDKFEKRLDEYRTQSLNRMQQYAKKEDDQVDRTDKLA